MRVLAQPLCAVLIFCFTLYCDGFFALAHANRVRAPHREDPTARRGCTERAPYEWGPLAGRSFSETAPGGPIGAVLFATATVQWDFDGRMVAATTPTGALTFSYDVDGIRWRKTVGGVVTHFVVDKNRDFAQVLEERDAAGNVQIAYIYGDDLISQETAAFGFRFYHADGQMSTRQLTDASANVTDTYTFDAFGVTLASSGSTANNYLYTGEQMDPQLGFYYLRARYLNQRTGRFVSGDPAAGNPQDPMTLHKYSYAGLDPVVNGDPAGLQFTKLEILGALVILAILVAIVLLFFRGIAPPNRVHLDWTDFDIKGIILESGYEADEQTIRTQVRQIIVEELTRQFQLSSEEGLVSPITADQIIDSTETGYKVAYVKFSKEARVKKDGATTWGETSSFANSKVFLGNFKDKAWQRTVPADPAGDKYHPLARAIANIALHEIGHGFKLAHSYGEASVMDPVRELGAPGTAPRTAMQKLVKPAAFEEHEMRQIHSFGKR